MQFIARTLASARTPLSRRHRLGLLALLVVGTGLLLAGCASTRPPPGVTAVTPFDVQRYAGRWYELARLDHAFERGMTDVTATYTAQADGSVRVVNRGYAPATGQWREAVGKALFTGAPMAASFAVNTIGPALALAHFPPQLAHGGRPLCRPVSQDSSSFGAGATTAARAKHGDFSISLWSRPMAAAVHRADAASAREGRNP